MPKIILYTVDGVTAQLPALCMKYGINESTVRERMRVRGMDIERALKEPLMVFTEEPVQEEETKEKKLTFIRTGSISGYYGYS